MAKTREPVKVQGLPHQIQFWDEMRSDVNVALVGPYGTGKTFSLGVKCLLLKTQNRGLLDMLVEPTYPMVRDVLWPSLEKIIWGDMGIHVTFNKTDSNMIWPWPGFQPTLLRSADNPDRLVGSNLASVGWDEPGLMRQEAWQRGSIRARHPDAVIRQNYLTGTPEGMDGFFAHEFAHPKHPNITIRAREWHPDMAAYPQQIERTYQGNPALLASYLEGKFVPLFVGICYRAFDAATHVGANSGLGYNKALPLILACDFNIDAMRWLVMQLHPGEIQVLDEIALGYNGDVSTAAREFCSRYAPQTGTVQPHAGRVIVTGDPAGKARSQTGHVCYTELLSVLREHWPNVALNVPKAAPAQRDRVDTVNYHLSGGGRRVRIHPQCTELIMDLERNHWREGTADIHKPTTGEGAKRTHAADAFGYMVWQFAPIQRPHTVSVGRKPRPAERHEETVLEARF